MALAKLYTKPKGHADAEKTVLHFTTEAELFEFVESWSRTALESLMKHNVAHENYEACAVIKTELDKYVDSE